MKMNNKVMVRKLLVEFNVDINLYHSRQKREIMF